MKTDWKDVAIRALKTFVQSFGGAIVVLLSSGADPLGAFSKTAIISAIAAALSAVWNGVINPALSKSLEPPA